MRAQASVHAPRARIRLGAAIDPVKLTESLCAVATAAWRIRRSLTPGDGKATEAERKSLRHVATIEDSLGELGLTVQDHDGARFNSGSSLRVLAFQPVAGFEVERVLETVKPSIYYQSRLIQVGEVIVSAPDSHISEEPDRDGGPR